MRALIRPGPSGQASSGVDLERWLGAAWRRRPGQPPAQRPSHRAARPGDGRRRGGRPARQVPSWSPWPDRIIPWPERPGRPGGSAGLTPAGLVELLNVGLKAVPLEIGRRAESDPAFRETLEPGGPKPGRAPGRRARGRRGELVGPVPRRRRPARAVRGGGEGAPRTSDRRPDRAQFAADPRRRPRRSSLPRTSCSACPWPKRLPAGLGSIRSSPRPLPEPGPPPSAIGSITRSRSESLRRRASCSTAWPGSRRRSLRSRPGPDRVGRRFGGWPASCPSRSPIPSCTRLPGATSRSSSAGSRP